MPTPIKTSFDSAGDHEKKYSTQNHDIEANKPVQSPTTPSFPGTTYGFEPSDQPADPPRRIPSVHSLKHNRSLASLRRDPNAPVPPLPSNYTQQGQLTTNQQHDDQASVEEELAWGPSHPCFPHLNPHVPLSSPLYNSTRIIRIRRDWMIAGDLAPTYSNIYPEILDPLVSEPEFRRIINHINTTLLEAFDPFSTMNWLDGFFGLITGWLWEDFRPAVGVKGKLRALEQWLDMWNERIGSREGVKLISLRRTAYMGLDIQIPDPQVKVVGEETDIQRGEGADGHVEDGARTGNGSISGYGLESNGAVPL